MNGDETGEPVPQSHERKAQNKENSTYDGGTNGNDPFSPEASMLLASVGSSQRFHQTDPPGGSGPQSNHQPQGEHPERISSEIQNGNKNHAPDFWGQIVGHPLGKVMPQGC